MAEWIGVDLDGTLAEYHGWNGPCYIGDPIPTMVKRVKEWLKAGIEVRIFTARASLQGENKHRSVKAIRRWCWFNIGQSLRVTCKKDFECRQIWDDRAVQVEYNTGMPICRPEEVRPCGTIRR